MERVPLVIRLAEETKDIIGVCRITQDIEIRIKVELDVEGNSNNKNKDYI